MAITVNTVKEGESNGAKLYTGIAAFRVTAINPSQEQLKAMGYKAEKAPEYQNPSYGTKIHIHVEATVPGGDKIKSALTYFVKDKKRDTIFINKLGKFSNDATKVLGETRHPFDGEIELLGFINDWANVKKDQELYLESIEAIVRSANVTELLQILNANKDGIFKGLATVRDGKYQAVYSKAIVRGFSTNYEYLHKNLVKEQAYIKDDIGGIDFKLFVPSQFELKPWTGQMTSVANQANTTNHSNGTTAPPAQDQGDAATADDDLPF